MSWEELCTRPVAGGGLRRRDVSRSWGDRDAQGLLGVSHIVNTWFLVIV